MTENLEEMSREKLIELVASLRKTIARRDEQINRLVTQLSQRRQIDYDALPEIDPYDH